MFGCLFGHDPEYVGVKHERLMFWMVPLPEFEYRNASLCRWICRRCGKMGESKREGWYKVEFGKLLPDAKAWANFDEKVSS